MTDRTAMRPLCSVAVAVAAALAGCGDAETRSATTTAPRALDLRVAAHAIPAPVGDVDGDRRADVVLVDDDALLAWLLTSRGRGALVTLDHVSSGPFGQAGHEVVALGDVDGDGLADMALPNDRSGLAIVYGARRWPERPGPARRRHARGPGARQADRSPR